MEKKFQRAADKASLLVNYASDDELLEIYSFYKQATEGDNNRVEPWRIQVREHAKWQAWKDLEGTNPDRAAEIYVDLISSLSLQYDI